MLTFSYIRNQPFFSYLFAMMREKSYHFHCYSPFQHLRQNGMLRGEKEWGRQGPVKAKASRLLKVYGGIAPSRK